jgi:hypothetical protein
MKNEPAEQDADARQLFMLRNRLNWILREKPRIYRSFDKDGTPCIEFSDEKSVEAEKAKGHEVKLADNKRIITELRLNILSFEKKLAQAKPARNPEN